MGKSHWEWKIHIRISCLFRNQMMAWLLAKTDDDENCQLTALRGITLSQTMHTVLCTKVKSNLKLTFFLDTKSQLLLFHVQGWAKRWFPQDACIFQSSWSRSGKKEKLTKPWTHFLAHSCINKCCSPLLWGRVDMSITEAVQKVYHCPVKFSSNCGLKAVKNCLQLSEHKATRQPLHGWN